jgi:hypothetical protein
VAAGQLIACADDGRSVREAVEGLQVLYRVEVEIAACGEDVLQFGQAERSTASPQDSFRRMQ